MILFVLIKFCSCALWVQYSFCSSIRTIMIIKWITAWCDSQPLYFMHYSLYFHETYFYVKGKNLNNPLTLFRKQNGIILIFNGFFSDLWERTFLGNAASSRTALLEFWYLLTFASCTGRSAELKCKLETAVWYAAGFINPEVTAQVSEEVMVIL